MFGRRKKQEKKSNVKDEKKSNVKDKKKSNVKVFHTYSYISQEHFRGFKRVHVSTYPMREHMAATNALIDKYPNGFSGLRVDLNIIQIQADVNNYNAIHVVIDGLIVGTIWENNEYYEVIRKGLVKEVYVKSEQRTIIGDGEVEHRNQIILLIKI